MSNLYQMLGVRDGANPAEIELAYKGLTQAQEAVGLDFEEQLELAMAYKTLMHPQRRAEYDRQARPMAPVLQLAPPIQQQPVVNQYYHQQNTYITHNYAPNLPQNPRLVARQVATHQAAGSWLTSFVIGCTLAYAAVGLLWLVLL
jgi:hypothetical protein